jgi:hypothetical protein
MKVAQDRNQLWALVLAVLNFCAMTTELVIHVGFGLL